MLKIPYGISDYKILKEDGFYYVDKTNYLEKLENVGRTLIYLRPGRFGKTLFTSMLYYYYDVNSKDLFETLFKDTYIHEHPTKDKNNYYVFKLDFSGMTTNSKDENELELQFKRKIADGIQKFNDDYKVNANVDFLNNTSNGMILDFLSYYSLCPKSIDL